MNKLRWAFSLSALALTLGLGSCASDNTNNAPSASGSSPAGGSPAATKVASGSAATISGAGATAPNPLYQRWFQEYNKANPAVQISYDSVGSGAGVKRFVDQTVDFAASDDPIKAEEKQKVTGGVVQVPSTGVFIVFAYNLDGVDGLKLSRNAFCGIVDGSIKTWNDPIIAKDNAGAKLPSTPVNFVHRSDGSGTTAIFTRHIEKACPNWKAGSGKTVEWPVGTGAKGNEGVAAQIQQTPGAIGYTEFSYASANKLKAATIQNKAGEFIPPTPDAAAKALAGAKPNADLAVSVPDPEAKEAYPIVSLTYLLLYQQPKDAAKAKAFNEFLKWAYANGKSYANELGYIPLPDEIITKATASLDTIKVAAK